MKKEATATPVPLPTNTYAENAAYLQNAEMFETQIQATIKTSLTARYYPKKYEVNTQPSKTIPDQTMSLKTILDRFARGIPMNVGKTPIYENDENALGIDVRSLDLADKERIKEANQANIQNLRTQLEAQKAPKAAPNVQTPTTTPETPANGL